MAVTINGTTGIQAPDNKMELGYFSNDNSVDTAITIPSGDNAAIVGPVTVNQTITVNGTLTVL
jgi:hypothetical protein